MTHYAVIEYLHTRDLVTQDPAEWTLWASGQLPDAWPLRSWITPTSTSTPTGTPTGTAAGTAAAGLADEVGEARHRARRARLAPVLTGRLAQQHLQPRIRQIAAHLVRELPAHTDQHQVVDLRRYLALPLALDTLAALIGVPRPLHHNFQRACAPLLDARTDPHGHGSTDALALSRPWFQSLVEVRCRPGARGRQPRPAKDLLAHLATTHPRLSDPQMADLAMLMVGTGILATTNLITATLHALLTHPYPHAHAPSGRRPSWERVVNETLRWAAPPLAAPLYFTRIDLTLNGGHHLPQGQALVMCRGAANRDPAAFGPDADRFDPTAERPPHLSFGRGLRSCLGAALAKHQTIAALELLFRFHHPRLAVPTDRLRPVPGPACQGWAELPVHLPTLSKASP
ncbi:cytochrome P450 [Actinomadura kijaniata]|uniref:cytochrome P450 n=1 Tax=Actinomadura kijaniata TaxID=46161 RepID=UPI003F534D22